MNHLEQNHTDRVVPVMPANTDAEAALLGSILIDPEALPRVTGTLEPNDFYRQAHGWIFEAMISVSGNGAPVDMVTLTDALMAARVSAKDQAARLDAIGGPGAIMDLMNVAPTALHVEHYARIVKRQSVLRAMIAAAGQMAEIAYAAKDEQTAIAQAQEIVMRLGGGAGDGGLTELAEPIQSAINRIDFMCAGGDIGAISSGFRAMDGILGGFNPSDLTIMAARPGMGKTALALSLALNAAKDGKKVGIFSLEMSAEQLVMRLLSMLSGIDSQALRVGNVDEEQWPLLMDAANTLAGLSIYIDDAPGATAADVCSKTAKAAMQYGLDMVIVDYLQLMAGTGSSQHNRNAELGQISMSLKRLAMTLDIPVIALSQLSRAVESRADKRPMLSDLRDSGELENNADVIMFVYREDYYIPDTDRQNITDIIVAKYRHGGTGTASLYFRKGNVKFADIELVRTDLP